MPLPQRQGLELLGEMHAFERMSLSPGMVGYGAHQSARFMHCNDESAAAAAASVVCIGGYCVLRVEINGCNKHPSSFNRPDIA